MKNIFKKFIGILFPEDTTCVFCGGEIFHNNKSNVCEKCEKSLPFINGNFCEICCEPISDMSKVCLRCKGKKHEFIKVRSSVVYKNEIVPFVHKFKENNGKYMAKTLAYYMAETYKKNNFVCDVIIPVPMHSAKQKKRGYNQTALIGKYLSLHLNVPMCNNLVKFKATKSQTKLNYKERQININDSFNVFNKNEIKNKVILLIDDIYTTGATTKECSKVLNSAGVKSVYVLTFAHTEIKRN